MGIISGMRKVGPLFQIGCLPLAQTESEYHYVFDAIMSPCYGMSFPFSSPFNFEMSLRDLLGQTIDNLDSTAAMTGQPPSSIVPEEPDPTHPTLPPDFPEHILLQICDSILQPALSPYSPIRPHARPWIRASPARAPCKSDLLALCYANKRLYTVCSDQIYRHVRVATLAVADMFVSRRNLLRNTS